MTQQEVIDVLKKAKKPMTAKQIASKLSSQYTSVTTVCKRLRKNKGVMYTYKKKEGFIYFP